jgi:hypothetical protein
MSARKPFSFAPMLRESADRLPESREWRYELKLDRFHGLTKVRDTLVLKEEGVKSLGHDLSNYRRSSVGCLCSFESVVMDWPVFPSSIRLQQAISLILLGAQNWSNFLDRLVWRLQRKSTAMAERDKLAESATSAN